MASATRGGATLGYAYDPDGRNAWAGPTGGASTAYVYDLDGHLLAEQDAARGAMLREYVWLDDAPIAIVDANGGSPTLSALTTGQIDEPLMVTASDQSVMLNGYVDPYGRQGLLAASSYTLNLRLPGQYWQGSAHLSQNGYRDYQPSLGRYIEPDPIGIEGGGNAYGYVGGDPLIRADPRGLFDPTPLTFAERAALGEEVVGGGPEDPFADVAAVLTLGAGLFVAELTPDPTQNSEVIVKTIDAKVGMSRSEIVVFHFGITGKYYVPISLVASPGQSIASGCVFVMGTQHLTTAADLMNGTRVTTVKDTGECRD